METQPYPFFDMYSLWLLSHHNQRIEIGVDTILGLQSLKYLLSGPLQDKFADPWLGCKIISVYSVGCDQEYI